MDPCTICDFFVANLTKIYFVYGLAFFITGIVVWLEASRHSTLKLAETLPFLAVFGLIHGTHEWLEMFEKMGPGPVGAVARIFRLVVLILSFFPLVEFGLRLGALAGSKWWRLARWILLALFLGGTGLIWLRWSSAGRQVWVPAIDAWCRYSLAVPGSVLAAVGLHGYAGSIGDGNGRRTAPCDLQVVAVAFLLYGMPGQVFVGASVLPPSTVVNSDLFLQMFHFPVQLLRTLMALLVVIFMGRGVRCFERERQRRMERLNRERLEAQRRLTEEMAERRQLQRELLHRTVQAQEEERRYIARELHDETAQALTALSLGLGGVEEAVGECSQEARGRLEGLRRLVDDMMKKVNQLTTRLRPTMLDDLGLIPALITYADESARHLPFTVDVEVTGQRRRLPSELETTLYRIVQESLTNVARHAEASQAIVRLHLGTREVTLKISDNGIGMAPERAEEAALDGEGWGLAGMRERTTLLGGDMVIHTRPGAGTEIVVRIPLPDSSPSREGEGS
jgi:signal transduction histidine kinase